MARVLATDEARTAIAAIQAVLDGSMTDTLTRLQQQGQVLCSPESWDGQLAAQFRSETWPAHERAFLQMKGSLEALREQVARINTDILSAGGNA